MIALNYLYFLIISILGCKWLTSSGGYMKSPLDKTLSMRLDGPEMFWILTFSTGLLAFSAPAGLDLMAVRLLVIELLCIMGLFLVKRRPVWSAAAVFYSVFMLWLVVGCFYSPAPAYGVRVIMKYVYVLLIMLFASAAVRDAEVFLKSSIGARTVGWISILVFFVPGLSYAVPGVFWYGTAAAINYISLFTLSLALFYFTDEKRKNLWFCLLFALPCVLWVFRTSIMGTTLALMVFMFFKYRFKSLPIIFGAFVLFICAVFFIPSVREKMFNETSDVNISQLESGSITKDDIDSNGRFAMWEWSMAKYYDGHELTGSGTGNLQEVFYSLRHPFGSIRIVHCDYVQMLCDNGLIGIILFGCCFVCLIGHSFFVFQNKRYDTATHICAIVAGSSAAGVLLTMMTDNVINYSMATISYPCGFYGMMLGLLTKYKKA